MGGTRFVGKALVEKLQSTSHELTLFTRGKKPVPKKVDHIIGDRKDVNDLKSLEGRSFDVIVDSSGRTLSDTQGVLEKTGIPRHRFLYVSSAGVYADSNELPLDEESAVDRASRHIGKFETEEWLRTNQVPFTSFRPTYIYGPGNYNPVEKWFFDRIIHDQPVPIPDDGMTITQLGHVVDLAEAMTLSLYNDKAVNSIYNCSGIQGVTFLGLVQMAALACGKSPDQVQLQKFDSSLLDSKARKLFPLRISHFLTNTNKIQTDLSWKPSFTLLSGLKDSYQNDYLINREEQPDFRNDQILIAS